jgi:hypothetical protein
MGVIPRSRPSHHTLPAPLQTPSPAETTESKCAMAEYQINKMYQTQIYPSHCPLLLYVSPCIPGNRTIQTDILTISGGGEAETRILSWFCILHEERKCFQHMTVTPLVYHFQKMCVRSRVCVYFESHAMFIMYATHGPRNGRISNG